MKHLQNKFASACDSIGSQLPSLISRVTCSNMTRMHMTAPFPRLEDIRPCLLSGMPSFCGYLRVLVLAALLSLPVTKNLHAEGARPEWLPEALELPADMEVLSDRAIGSSLRMFSFTTQGDAATLLVEWQEDLRLSGFTIDDTKDELLDQIIEFSGPGINSAKIVIASTDDDGRAIIEFDATLE